MVGFLFIVVIADARNHEPEIHGAVHCLKSWYFTSTDNVAYFFTGPGRCECSLFHDYSVQDYIFPGYDTVTLGNNLPTFRTAFVFNSQDVLDECPDL
jgi:hypothetical protein